MYIVALDEAGKFENKNCDQNSPLMIAGVIYDDGIEKQEGENDEELKRRHGEEENAERVRIRAYYENVIKEVRDSGMDAAYPESLHVSRGVRSNSAIVREVKRRVSETFGEFLSDGTFRGRQLMEGNGETACPQRKGSYYIYAIVNSEEGKKNNKNFLEDDGVASNEYLHMVFQALDRCIFNTTFAEKDSEFVLNLATRSVFVKKDYSKEYKVLGYSDSNREGEDEVQCFKLTNFDVFRTALVQKLSEDNSERASIKRLHVGTIYYGSESRYHEFKFLADSVCSLISNGLEEECAGSDGKESDGKWIQEIDRRMNALVGEEKSLLYIYDEIDTQFAQALRKFHIKDYYGALEVMYNASKEISFAAKYYSNRWFRYLENRIIADSEVDAFRRALNALYESQLTNRYDQGKGLYIGTVLERQSESVKKRLRLTEDRKVFYRLFECLMISYCHIGDSASAKKYYLKLSSYAYGTTVEDYLRAGLMYCVYNTDSLQWRDLVKIAKDNCTKSAKYCKMKKEISSDFLEAAQLALAKSESTLGQIYGFMRNPEAEKYFNRALIHIGSRNPAANYYITESYLLHHYLDIENLEKYKDQSFFYFGKKKDDAEILEYILNEGLKENPIFSCKFALYVYIKGLYLTGGQKIKEGLWKYIKNLEENINRQFGKRLAYRFSLTNHPSELICKYIYMIAVQRGDKEAAELYLRKMEESVAELDPNGGLSYKSDLLHAIVLKGKLDGCVLGGDSERAALFEDEIFILLCRIGSVWKCKRKPTARDKRAVVEKYMTYMYN